MAKRPTLSNVSTGYLSSTQVNANNTEIETAFDNTLSRDGSSPNTMGADLDLNSNDILNTKNIFTTGLYIGGSLISPTAVSAVSGIETFSTVAAMVADTALIIGQVVETEGYYSVGDGGGNRYEIVAASTGTVDGGSYIDLTGSSLQAKHTFNNVVNVKQFGCVGDGTANDTTDLQAAFNAGNTLYIPSGTYLLTLQITATENKMVYGDGMAQTVLRWDSTATTYGLDFTCGVGEYTIQIQDIGLETEEAGLGTAIGIDMSAQISGGSIISRITPRFRINNVAIRGVTDAATDGWDVGIDVVSALGGVISGCSFEGKGAAGSFDSTSGFKFSGAGNPVEFNVSDCSIYQCTTAIEANACEGVNIHNSNLVAVGVGVLFDGSTAEPQLNVHDCHINVYTTCIDLDYCNQFNLHNNLLYSRSDATTVTGIIVQTNSANGIIKDNIFIENGTSTLTCINLIGDEVTIGGNKFSSTNGITINSAALDPIIRRNEYISVSTTKISDSSVTTTFEYHPEYSGDLDSIRTVSSGAQLHRIVTGATNVPSGITVNGSMVETISWDTSSGHQIVYPLNQTTIYMRRRTSGTWGSWVPFARQNLESFTAVNIADVSNSVNTSFKAQGRQVYDGTNNRMMIADGSAAADIWTVADGSASVTPS